MLRRVLVCCAALGGVMGCNQPPVEEENAGPWLYRMAIDDGVLRNLPGSCYRTGAPPTDLARTTSVREPRQWVIWNGAEPMQFLEVGPSYEVVLGDAGPVKVGSLIEGQGNLFTAERVETQTDPFSQFVAKRTSRLTVTFDELDELARGRILAEMTAECPGCPPTEVQVSCRADLTFTGRRIPADSTVAYAPTGG